MPEPGVLFPLDDVAGVEGDVEDGPNDNIEARQTAARSPQDVSDPPPAKAGTARRWFAGAMLRMIEFVAKGLVYTDGR